MKEIIVDKQGMDITSELDVNEKNIVVFKQEDPSTICEQLNKINIWEIERIESKENCDVSLNFKELSFDTRVVILKWALTHFDLVDSTLVLNIFNLIKGFNNCDSSFFDAQEVMFNSFEEFIDIKTLLKEDLIIFRKELAKYYYSIIRTVGATVFPDNALPVIIPLVYQRIFLISDFISLSNMVRNFKSIDELVFVENAEMFLQSLATRYVFAGILMKKAGVVTGE